jgi:hypothetical protein
MDSFYEISQNVPFFKEKERKNMFLIIVGALSLRLISLRKAAVILNLDEKTLLEILESAGYSFSFLEKEDIEIEKEW